MEYPLRQLNARVGFSGLYVADRRDIDAKFAGEIQPIWLNNFPLPVNAHSARAAFFQRVIWRPNGRSSRGSFGGASFLHAPEYGAFSPRFATVIKENNIWSDPEA